MKEDFEALYNFMEANNISQNRVPFSIYNTFDIFKGETNYVACIPLEEEIDTPNGWIRSHLPKGNALKTMHKGRYLHLGNGWMTAMSFVRMKKMKMRTSPVGYEFYPTNPYETAEEALITEIYLPLK